MRKWWCAPIPVRSVGTILATAVLLALSASTASATVLYDNIPNPLPGNLPSLGFQAQHASEFGGQLALSSGPRVNPTVTVVMSSQLCQSSSPCQTTPGAKFSLPITLSLYDVNPNNSPGSLPGNLIQSETQTFQLPFRPSADPINCTGANAGRWFDGTKCQTGIAVPISFDLTSQSLVLPDNLIASVAYNTSDYGYQPIGPSPPCHSSAAGCPYDSLNVAVTAPPSVGSDPLPNDAYFNSSDPAEYCDNGTAGVGIFRLDTSCWTGEQPAIKITSPAPAPSGSPAASPGVCVVPGLKGKRLGKARKALQRADCHLGNLRRKGRKPRRVRKQNPKPGTVLPAGSTVDVTAKHG